MIKCIKLRCKITKKNPNQRYKNIKYVNLSAKFLINIYTLPLSSQKKE